MHSSIFICFFFGSCMEVKVYSGYFDRDAATNPVEHRRLVGYEASKGSNFVSGSALENLTKCYPLKI